MMSKCQYPLSRAEVQMCRYAMLRPETAFNLSIRMKVQALNAITQRNL